jgi:ubiquinone/menaquinone biosynthesis C-methylase UbiE
MKDAGVMDTHGVALKRTGEMAYWSERKDVEGRFQNSWFEHFYTIHFGLTPADYTGKRVLDIGCGPRGSLDWATAALERVGVDPLAEEYMKLGAGNRGMIYVAAGAESVPFPDHYFNFVCSFNSLDHVDDLDASIREMKRLVAVGGLVLLLTDVHETPTPQEPICFGWDVVDLFGPELVPQSIRCYEKSDAGMYRSIDQGVFFNHCDTTSRYGVLSARFVRLDAPESGGVLTNPSPAGG